MYSIYRCVHYSIWFYLSFIHVLQGLSHPPMTQFNSLPTPEVFSVPRQFPSKLILNNANLQQLILDNAKETNNLVHTRWYRTVFVNTNVTEKELSKRVAYNLHSRFKYLTITVCTITLIASFMGTTWGPPWTDRTQVGPMLALWTLLSGNISTWFC